MSTARNAPPAELPSDDLVSLESVLCTDELNRRPSRPPDHEKENHALVVLAQALADAPGTILQTLADTILEVFDAQSAGVSLLTADGTRFYWPAIAGVWKAHIGGGTPRDFGPCGDVLDFNTPLMFRHFERRYRYFLEVAPPASECLLVPFYVNGKAVGTIWAITHDERRRFDAEDLRMLVSLGAFASSAYQAIASRKELERGNEALQQRRIELDQRVAELKRSNTEVQESRRAALNLMEDAILARDKLSEADRHKTEFLAMLAHELRNPLAPIVNALHMLDIAGTNAAVSAHARQVMGRQVRQIVRLVDDLLDVSRVSRGKIVLRTSRIALSQVLEDAVDAGRVRFDEKQVALTVALPDADVYLCGDSARLTQVMGNLLDNACKFTPQGGSVHLSAKRVGDEVVIRVQDTGIGIASNQVERIFDMFVQADVSLGRSEGGLGIGLTLVKNLVDLHGGTVEVHSPGLGKGSEFVMRLPAEAEERFTSPELFDETAAQRPGVSSSPDTSGSWHHYRSTSPERR